MEGVPREEPKPQQEGIEHAGPAAPDPAERQPEIIPRIYVASLSDYNAGRLHGIWINAAQEPDDLQLHINAMLARSRQPNAEEWAIHDFEGFNGLHLGEWENLEHVSKVAYGIQEHGLAFAHWATLVSADEELDQFEDHYHGRWDSLTAYAESFLDDMGIEAQLEAAIPEYLQPYVRVDAEAFGRDLELGGDVTTTDAEEGGVHVFRAL